MGLLVLSWDKRHLTGIDVSPSASGPSINAGFSVDWPEQGPTANWLSDTLRRNGINSRQAALALPREDIVLRLLELPAVADEELPTLVRFQAAARSAQSIDQLLLDFLPLPQRDGVSQKEVWLATTLQTTVDPIRTLLSEAGIDLTQVTISSLCLTELIARGEARRSLPSADASLVVLRDGYRMELAVVCQRQLIAAHAVKWSSASEIPPVGKMLAEVSRVLVQVQAWLPEGTLQRVWVIGEDADVGDLPDAIGQRWKCPVERFDTWRDAGLSPQTTRLSGSAEDYATAAGLALVQSGAVTPKIDLLNPRQPPAKRDPRKPYIVAAAAAGLLLTAMITAFYGQALASYDSEIEALRKQDITLTQNLKLGDPVFEAIRAIDLWQTKNINHLKQIDELHVVMNGTENVVIGDYKFSPGAGDVLGHLKIVGNARDRADAEELRLGLSDLKKFAIRPPGSSPEVKRDPDYSFHFDLDMDLTPVAAKR